MVSTDSDPRLPRAAIDLLTSRCLQIAPPVVALRMWERCFTPQERDELGGRFEHAFETWRTVGMWQQVRGGSYYGAVVAIAFWIGLLTRADYEWLLRLLDETARSELDHILDSARLVIVEWPRELYFEGTKVEISWENKPSLWNYLFTLIESAKRGELFDHLSLGGEIEPNHPSKLKSRLASTSGFPRSLAACIQPAGRGTQRLEVPADEITIVRSEHGAILR